MGNWSNKIIYVYMLIWLDLLNDWNCFKEEMRLLRLETK